jgi:hypothetical protein
MQLSEETVQKIRELVLDPDAEIISCTIPLGSILWSDEIPYGDFSTFLKEIGVLKKPDFDEIMKLFTVRVNYWNDGTMSDEDGEYWEQAHKEYPDWPIFQRKELTSEQRRKHNVVQKETAEALLYLMSRADEAEVVERDGVISYSATFNLETKRKRRWWQARPKTRV